MRFSFRDKSGNSSLHEKMKDLMIFDEKSYSGRENDVVMRDEVFLFPQELRKKRP
jgi:hypothetical protein